MLDGQVLMAPSTNAVITDGQPMIAGGFTEASAKQLAARIAADA